MNTNNGKSDKKQKQKLVKKGNEKMTIFDLLFYGLVTAGMLVVGGWLVDYFFGLGKD